MDMILNAPLPIESIVGSKMIIYNKFGIFYEGFFHSINLTSPYVVLYNARIVRIVQNNSVLQIEQLSTPYQFRIFNAQYMVDMRFIRGPSIIINYQRAIDNAVRVARKRGYALKDIRSSGVVYEHAARVAQTMPANLDDSTMSENGTASAALSACPVATHEHIMAKIHMLQKYLKSTLRRGPPKKRVKVDAAAAGAASVPGGVQAAIDVGDQATCSQAAALPPPLTIREFFMNRELLSEAYNTSTTTSSPNIDCDDKACLDELNETFQQMELENEIHELNSVLENEVKPNNTPATRVELDAAKNEMGGAECYNPTKSFFDTISNKDDGDLDCRPFPSDTDTFGVEPMAPNTSNQ